MTGKGREVADLMARRNIDILCVQETKWSGKKAKELGEGYKLYYHGYNSKRNGVGIILKSGLKEGVVEVNRVDDSVILMRLEVNGEIISTCTYATQIGYEEEEKKNFWYSLDETMGKVSKEEKLIIGADFNGHVGERNVGEESVLGRYGLGQRNEGGEEIVNFATRNDMAITNTFFKKREEHRVTYKSGGRKTQIDYVLCRRNNLKEITDCKVVVGENITSQHRLVVCRANLGYRRKRMKIAKPKIRWWKLKENDFRERFITDIHRRLGRILPPAWKETAETIRTVGKEVLGQTSGKGKGDRETWWWNEKVQDAIKEKKETWKNWDSKGDEISKKKYKEAKQLAKKMVAKAKAEAYQDLYDGMETEEGQKAVYRIAKQRDRAGKDIQHVKLIKDEQGRVLSDEEEILKRWKDYFEKLMNEENGREKREQGVKACKRDVQRIGKEEVQREIQRMKNGKAVGPDNIPVEVWKCLGDVAVEFLTTIYNNILEEGNMPEEWRRSILVPIYKNRGDVQDCNNYRGIKLMSHTMKIWERVIENRLREEVTVCKEQFGFMPKRSTTDAIFALRVTAEKYREGQKELHCVFIDLEKAYDRVPREELWYCMREKGVDEVYIRLVQDMYKDSETVVRTAIGTTEPFTVAVGLHQGSALSPFLFTMVMDVLTEQVRREAPWNMLFADDIVLINEEKGKAAEELEKWCKTLEKRGMKVSRTKTEYICINKMREHQKLKLQNQEVPEKEEFKYLGSTIQSDGGSNMEVKRRIQAGWNGWKKVTGVQCDKRVPVVVKGKIHRTMVRPAMLYGMETLPLTKEMSAKLDVAEMRMLRWSLGKTRKDKIRNETIRETLGVAEVSKKAREGRLRWFGHVKRRDEDHVGRKVLEMKLPGTRRRGRPKRRWMDNIKEDMAEAGVDEQDAEDRTLWKQRIRCGDP